MALAVGKEGVTKVRTRLVLAFAYILIAVIVALTVPLAVNLGERARTEQIGQAEVTAQALSAVIGAEALAPGDRDRLQRQAQRYSEQIGGRVIVMDTQGEVLADANPFPEPPSAVGENYDTASRPEAANPANQGEFGRRASATSVRMMKSTPGPCCQSA